jgi:L-amino acid N-acyltransferase YncA
VRQTDITIRRTTSDDLDDIARIYTHHVHTGVATFELDAPDQT